MLETCVHPGVGWLCLLTPLGRTDAESRTQLRRALFAPCGVNVFALPAPFLTFSMYTASRGRTLTSRASCVAHSYPCHSRSPSTRAVSASRAQPSTLNQLHGRGCEQGARGNREAHGCRRPGGWRGNVLALLLRQRPGRRPALRQPLTTTHTHSPSLVINAASRARIRTRCARQSRSTSLPASRRRAPLRWSPRLSPPLAPPTARSVSPHPHIAC